MTRSDPAGRAAPPGSGEGDVPRLCRWLITANSWLAPPGQRRAWRLEWTGEVSYALRAGRSPALVAVRTMWSMVDAMLLWRGEFTMTGMLGDLKQAVRSFSRTPTLTGILLGTLALGIGASVTIFSIVDTVIVQRLPLPEPDRLVYYAQDNEARGIADWPFSYAGFRNLVENARTADFAAIFISAFNMDGSDGPIRVSAARVSDSFFGVTGLSPSRGRPFTRAEEAADRKLALLDYGFWTERMGSDPDLIGKTLVLQGETYEIIGVMRRDAHLVDQLYRNTAVPGDGVDLYIPLEPFGALQGDLVSTMRLLGRVHPGVTLERTLAEVHEIQSAFLDERGVTGWVTRATPLQDYLVARATGPLFILLGAVGVLLLMVCANVSAVLLVRSMGRSTEWAARQALGANRSRIVRQHLGEGSTLGLLGGLLGLALANGLVRWIHAVAPAGIPRVEELGVDGRATVFSLALAAATTVLFGLLPALAAARRPPAEALKARTQSPEGRRTLAGLVAVEVAIAIVLLTASGVLLRSLGNLITQDPGYTAQGVLRGTTDLERVRYPNDEDVLRFADRVHERLAAQAGVEAVAVTAMPMPTNAPSTRFQIDGIPAEEFRGSAMQDAVSPEYFDVLDIDLLEGRLFTAADRPGSPLVAIVTKAVADQYWPGGSAIGKRILIGSWRHFMLTGTATTAELLEIVGVVEDLTGLGVDPGDPVRLIYSRFAQDPWAGHTYLLKSEGSPGALAPILRSTVAAVDPGQPVYDVEVMMNDRRAAIGKERLSTLILGGFAAVALLLAALGIYGVVSHSVVLRRREIGVRMALGANVRSVSLLFFKEGFIPVAAGLLLGLGLAFWSVQLLRSLLYQVEPLDPLTFLGAGLVLSAAALASTYLPASRTARVDPVRALKPQ